VVPEIWPPPKTGRKPRMTDDTTKRIILAELSAGNSIEDAAAQAGVHRSTLYNYIAQGERIEAENARRRAQGLRPIRTRYSDFFDAIELARGRARATLVTSTYNHGLENGGLGLAILERIDARNWNVSVQKLMDELEDRLLDRMEEEFTNEPQILVRAYRAVRGLARQMGSEAGAAAGGGGSSPPAPSLPASTGPAEPEDDDE